MFSVCVCNSTQSMPVGSCYVFVCGFWYNNNNNNRGNLYIALSVAQSQSALQLSYIHRNYIERYINDYVGVCV